MVNYSDEEKKARRMVETYWQLIEANFVNEVPPHDDKQMRVFLKENKGDSQLINNLYEWVVNYDVLRLELRNTREKKESHIIRLFNLLDRPQLD